MQARSARLTLRGGALGLVIAPLAGFVLMWRHLALTPPSLCTASPSASGGLQVTLVLFLIEMICLAMVAASWRVLTRTSRDRRGESTGFIRAGSMLLPLGLVMSFGMILHCIARVAPAAPLVADAALLASCPWALSTLAVLGGSLGMIGIGLCDEAGRPTNDAASGICAFALAAMFFAGYAGYFVVGRPGLYPSATGRDVWLLIQLACMVLYAAGALAGFGSPRRVTVRAMI